MLWQTSGMKYRFAYLVSRVFDPILVTPMIFLVIFREESGKNYSIFFLLALLVFEALLPAVYVISKFVGRHMKDWDIKRKESRIPLMVFGLISQLVGLILCWWFGYMDLLILLLGLWVVLLTYLVVTYLYKMSVHAGVNAILAFMVTEFVGWEYWWLWLIPPLVSWSRLIVKQHSLGQVALGMSLPVFVLYGVYWLTGLI